jgi:hypothetical protein
MNTEKYHVLDEEQIKEAYKYQQQYSDWTFYSERKFVETLVSNRFNCLLVLYSLFVTAFATMEGKVNKIIILATGLLIMVLISWTIYRAYVKLDIILKILYDLGKQHVFPFIGNELKGKRPVLRNVNPIIGIWIPFVFIVSFIVAIILIATNIWHFV